MGVLAAVIQNAASEGRMFALDRQTLISTGIQLLNFCILAVVLGFVLYKPIQKYLRGRAEKIGGQMEDARKKMAEAEALKVEYEGKLHAIETERAAALESARAEANERSRQMLDVAHAEVAAIRKRAEENMRIEQEQFKREAWRHIVEVSSLMTEKLIPKVMDSEAHEGLFAETMVELEDIQWPN